MSWLLVVHSFRWNCIGSESASSLIATFAADRRPTVLVDLPVSFLHAMWRRSVSAGIDPKVYEARPPLNTTLNLCMSMPGIFKNIDH